MLVLTRKAGESIVINDNITITILGMQGNQIKIGIEAPKDIPVHRDEIYARILVERETMLNNSKNNGNIIGVNMDS